jgi:hypothetical protein
MSADWAAEFDGFLSSDACFEILDIDEADARDGEQIQFSAGHAITIEQPSSDFKEFQLECAMCCICWEPFLNEKETRLRQFKRAQFENFLIN